MPWKIYKISLKRPRIIDKVEQSGESTLKIKVVSYDATKQIED